VPSGSCATQDAGQVADGGAATLLDASPGEPESDVDAEAIESGPATDAQSASDGVENEVGVEQEDGPPPTEAGSADDGGGQEDLLAPDIDAESGNASLDGPEGAPSDAEISNSGDDGGTPAIEIDGASGADDTNGSVDDAITGNDAPAVDGTIADDGGEDDSSLLCVGCADADDADDAGDADDSAGDETGVVLRGADAADSGDGAGDGTGVLYADDGGVGDASDDGTAIADASGAVVDGASQDTGPLQCPDRWAVCSDQCIDVTSDPQNCGTCGNMCSSDVCIDGACLVCAPIEKVCSRQCVNTGSNPDNCGGCDFSCGSGLCSNSQCEATNTGRIIVIGHDYLVNKNRTAMNQLLANAVLLWPINPVHLLAYKGAANQAAFDGANAAITQGALASGRVVQRIEAAAADVPTQLAAADVFLIYGQEQAIDATLAQLGQDWASAVSTFVNRGGTVIVLDGFYPGNTGTVQIVFQTGLFNIWRNVSVTNSTCTVVARGDALASGLLTNYRCEQNSVSFLTNESGTYVTSVVESGSSVVIDKLF
jgi:hypothetical protein